MTRRRGANKKYSMTLLEQIVVLVIVGVLLAIAGANYLAYKEKYFGRGGGARTEMRQEFVEPLKQEGRNNER